MSVEVGSTYGQLTVKALTEPKVYPSGQKAKRWLCRCSCGQDKVIQHSSLQSGATQSCGCAHKKAAAKNLKKTPTHTGKGTTTRLELTGQTFGRLTVIGLNRVERKGTYWDCECACGASHVAKGALLKFGHVKSCGCLSRDKAKARVASLTKVSTEKRRQNTLDVYLGETFHYLTVTDIEYNPTIAVARCVCGNVHRAYPYDLAAGKVRSCGCKSSGRSDGEREMCAFLRTLTDTLETDVRLNGSSIRFDAVCHKNKIAVEYNGVYWHSSTMKTRNYHRDKRRYAEEQGYRLISVWQHDWNTKRDKVEAILRRAFGVGPTRRLGARQTVLADLEYAEAAAFHSKGHLQDGRSVGSRHIGLTYRGELVAVATFKQRKADMELSRYTVAAGTTVAGGLGKILKYLAPEQPVVSYCDRDYFTGAVYDASGFEKTGESLQLFYCTDEAAFPRERFMKHKLPALGIEVREGESEDRGAATPQDLCLFQFRHRQVGARVASLKFAVGI